MNQQPALVLTIAAIVTAFVWTGCKTSYDYTYSAINQTDTVITIVVVTPTTNETHTLTAGEKKILYTGNHGLEKKGGPYNQDVKKEIKEFIVMKGVKRSTRDYLTNDAWTFSDGHYETAVGKGEF
jgi:hypothetical protein